MQRGAVSKKYLAIAAVSVVTDFDSFGSYRCCALVAFLKIASGWKGSVADILAQVR